MPALSKPPSAFEFDVADEFKNLSHWKKHHQVPAKAHDRPFVATWDVARFADQKRESSL